MNLGLSDFELDIRSHVRGFIYMLSFRLLATGRMYTSSGTCPTPDQCFDVAMSYVVQTVRDAVEA